MIWPQAEAFRLSASRTAGRVLARLDPALRPEVSLIGIRLDPAMSGAKFEFVPPDAGPTVDAFADLLERAAAIERDSTIAARPGDPAGRPVIEGVSAGSLGRAVVAVLRQRDEVRERITFGSWPVLVDDWWTMVVMDVDRATWTAFPSFDDPALRHEPGTAGSLPVAVVKEFLDAFGLELGGPDPGLYGRIEHRDTGELERAAGRRLMYTVALINRFSDLSPALFDACDVISTLPYENREASGRMIVGRQDDARIELALSLARPVGIRDHRTARKLLEMLPGFADDGEARPADALCLVADCTAIRGLARIREAVDGQTPLFLVDFLRHHVWELARGRDVLMRVTFGQPALPVLRVSRRAVQAALDDVFPELDERARSTVWRIVAKAARQRRGTLIIVSGNAAAEAARLSAQSIPVQPVSLDGDVLRAVTSIDGAVLLDPAGVCHGISVILDGEARGEGDPSRGARYNSAIRYVRSASAPCLAVVMSEDGYVDLIPWQRELSREFLSRDDHEDAAGAG